LEEILKVLLALIAVKMVLNSLHNFPVLNCVFRCAGSLMAERVHTHTHTHTHACQ